MQYSIKPGDTLVPPWGWRTVRLEMELNCCPCPNPSPGSWQCALPGSKRPRMAGATGHAGRVVTGSRPLLRAAGEP